MNKRGWEMRLAREEAERQKREEWEESVHKHYKRLECGMVYFIRARGICRIKIGWAKSDLEQRLKHLQTGSAAELILDGWIPGSRKTEGALHKRFRAFRIHGEWFKPDKRLKAFIREVADWNKLVAWVFVMRNPPIPKPPAIRVPRLTTEDVEYYVN